jgi:hypothetical protein
MQEGDRLSRRLFRQILCEAMAVTPKEWLGSALFLAAGYVYRALSSSGFPWKDLVSVVLPAFWTVAALLIYLTVRAVIHSHRQDIRALEGIYIAFNRRF